MKLILFLCLFSQFSFAAKKSKRSKKKRVKVVKTFYDLAKKQYKEKNYNLALYYLFSHIKKHPDQLNKSKTKVANLILSKTGTLPLYFYSVDFLKKIENPTINIHLANLYFKKKQYQDTINYAKKIKKNHNLYAEAQLILGSTKQLLGWGQYLGNYENCAAAAKYKTSKVKNKKFAKYFISIGESCLINISRDLYSNGEFKKSNESYLKLSKRSYSWPYSLLERAWNFYKQGDYNRTLGTLMTYQSPLLSSYFFPEAEVLKALSYYQLCLYNDSATLIDKFFKVYKIRGKTLKKFILDNKDDPRLFFNLVYKPKSEINQDPYILSLRNQLKKKIRVNLHLYSYKNASRELRNVIKNGTARDIKFARFITRKMEKMINRHVKEYYYYFVNQINFYSYEMFNIKLEIISRKKDLLYENKDLVAKRARGSLGNVTQSSSEFFYTFNGAFWADELGDYSFGLKSNCKKVKKEIDDKSEFATQEVVKKEKK